jgi:hypothetical protein
MKNKIETFLVDNQLIQMGPYIFDQSRAGMPYQLWLDGQSPFSTFDYWATVALYSQLDQKNPEDTVFVKPTDLLDLLKFTKGISESEGYSWQSNQSRDYALVEESLHRLRTIEVSFTRPSDKVRLAGQKGRLKNQSVEYRLSILQSYGYAYPEDVTPPELLMPADRTKMLLNVNKVNIRQPGTPAIWKYREELGFKPTAYHFRFATDLVRGISKQDPNIGATITPVKIFTLRSQLQKSQIKTAMLFWTIRQTSQDIQSKFPNLLKALNGDEERPARQYKRIEETLEIMRTAEVIEGFTIEGELLTIRKNKKWGLVKKA